MNALPLLAQRAACGVQAAAGGWRGVDDTVVGRVAAEAGRGPRPPLLPLDGDLLLFCFLVAGLAAGFVLGYGFRALFHERPGPPAERP